MRRHTYPRNPVKHLTNIASYIKYSVNYRRLRRRSLPGLPNTLRQFIADKYILTDVERNYVTKLVDILRGFNQQAKLAVKANIDALYHHKKERREIEKEYLQVE